MPKPLDFLSQITAALGTGLPGNTAPPRPKPRLSVHLPLVLLKTVEVEVSNDAYENGVDGIMEEIDPQLPTLLGGGTVPVALLTLPDDAEPDYTLVNSEELDAWDLQYGDTHDVDGTAFEQAEGSSDDADEDDDIAF